MSITASQEGRNQVTGSPPILQDQAIRLSRSAARAKSGRRVAWIARNNYVVISFVLGITLFECKGVSIHGKVMMVWLVVGEDISG